MGTVGIARGQLAPLSLFQHLSDGQFVGCNGIIGMTGLDGKVLASDKGTLMPGQGLFMDYDLAAGLRRGERVQFHADMMVPGVTSAWSGRPSSCSTARPGVSAIPPNPCGIPIPTQGN